MKLDEILVIFYRMYVRTYVVGALINIWFNIIYFIWFVILLVFNIALVMSFWYIFGCIYLYFMHTNSIIYLFEMSQYLAMLLCCAEQLRAQSLAIVDKNSKTGCPEGLRPVDTPPRTNWIVPPHVTIPFSIWKIYDFRFFHAITLYNIF